MTESPLSQNTRHPALLARYIVLTGPVYKSKKCAGGRDLVPVGGHNLLEPALAGVPVLFGPNTGQARALAVHLQGTTARIMAELAVLELSSRAQFISPSFNQLGIKPFDRRVILIGCRRAPSPP